MEFTMTDARKLAFSYGRRFRDEHDIGTLQNEIYLAAMKYNPECGIPFPQYIHGCSRNIRANLHRSYLRHGIPVYDGESVDVAERDNSDFLSVEVEDIRQNMTPEQLTFAELVRKYSIAEVADILGVARQTVHNKINAIREEFGF